MPDDLDLLARWREGDDEAGEELIRSHYTAVFAEIRAMVNGDADLASELTQRVFEVLLHKRDEIVQNVRAYLRARDHAIGIAAVPVDVVAVIAGLVRVDDAVAAGGPSGRPRVTAGAAAALVRRGAGGGALAVLGHRGGGGLADRTRVARCTARARVSGSGCVGLRGGLGRRGSGPVVGHRALRRLGARGGGGHRCAVADPDLAERLRTGGAQPLEAIDVLRWIDVPPELARVVRAAWAFATGLENWTSIPERAPLRPAYAQGVGLRFVGRTSTGGAGGYCAP